MGKRPPSWKNFDVWVLMSMLVGLGVAVATFFVLRRFLFGDSDGTGDIISGTATALGGLTIGGIAVMQYRKHKWAEYQAKLDEDTRTGERLSKAIEHLGNKDALHIRIGAIYEFKRLAQDSPRDKESVVEILTAFIKSRSQKLEEGQALPQDIEAAARVLSQLARELIEEMPKKASKEWRGRPPECVFVATKEISALNIKGVFQWNELKAARLNLRGINLKGARLFGANLEDAGISGANFVGVSLSRANLAGADLVKTNLAGAFLCDVFVDNKTNFRKTIIDEHTKFDPGVREKYFPDFGKEKGAED